MFGRLISRFSYELITISVRCSNQPIICSLPSFLISLYFECYEVSYAFWRSLFRNELSGFHHSSVIAWLMALIEVKNLRPGVTDFFENHNGQLIVNQDSSVVVSLAIHRGFYLWSEQVSQSSQWAGASNNGCYQSTRKHSMSWRPSYMACSQA